MKYKLYFHPRNRGYQNTKYIGLYRDKAIRAIGKVTGIIDVKYNENTNEFVLYEEIMGRHSKDLKDQIRLITKESNTK
ncbi:hypothetical protein [Bacillus sp. N1-1]|uniref:hypothetical protein n=1 Tax=Bacillus sp. N1-1 TaxID=2682541 RepID=UPI001316B374|nr:hypothetical protein [Bacillus sp. N1-1]QHA93126.1 hypothetical protein GNK04_17705 [Bacillus sp. N1-1]